MNQNNHSKGSSGATQQQQAVRAASVVKQTPSDAFGLSDALQAPRFMINKSSNAEPDEVFGGHDWSQPPMMSYGQAWPIDQCWSTSGAYQNYEGQRLDINGGAGLAHPNACVGDSLQHPHTAFPTLFEVTGQEQLFQPLSFWQPIEMMASQQHLPKKGLPQMAEPGHIMNHSGLLTPASTNAQDSPSEEQAKGTIGNFDNQSQQLWDHDCDTRLPAHSTSDGSMDDMTFIDFAAEPEQQPWTNFDFDSLNGLFGVDDVAMLKESAEGSDPAAAGQDRQLPFHRGGHFSHPLPSQSFAPFMANMDYPDLDVIGKFSEPMTVQHSSHPGSVGQAAAQFTASTLPMPVNVFDTPSLANSGPRIPAKSSQKENPKNALLIHYKEQGMSYKDIKALGGFEEAESTLRGRYRTLTKPKEERVRRPEWSARDVFLLFEAVRHITNAHFQSQRPSSSRGIPARRRAAGRIPWKQVSKYMADRGTYKYGYGTVKRKYEEINKGCGRS